MKKFIIFVSVIAMLAMLAGCGGDNSAETAAPVESASTDVVEPSEEVAVESEPAQSNAPLVIGGNAEGEDVEAAAPVETAAINEEDFVVVINGGELTFDMTMDSVFELLGTEYEYSEAISCAYDGMDKTFAYSDIEIYSWPDGDIDRVSEFLIFSDICTTARGITVGSTLDDVIAAYGQGSEVGSMVEYEALGRLISFNISDGVVADIDFMTVQED
ncbi:MAG: hypothetical protein E7430_01195 [Ruminococcaceae bacterium]|nr:hypothetical protein [Oscillospiraceae bacterium]